MIQKQEPQLPEQRFPLGESAGFIFHKGCRGGAKPSLQIWTLDGGSCPTFSARQAHIVCIPLAFSSRLLDTATWGHIASPSAAGGSQGEGRGNNNWRPYIKNLRVPSSILPWLLGCISVGQNAFLWGFCLCVCVCARVSISTHSTCGEVKGQLGWVGFLFLPR